MLPQVPATALQLAAKDREVRELHEENSLLRQQVTEMEKALQMGADLHAATQVAHQVRTTAALHHVRGMQCRHVALFETLTQ
jgi:uncharacterized protein (DUF3084 family)